MKLNNKKVGILMILLLVVIVIIIVSSRVGEQKEELYENMQVISEEEFNALPILDLGDGKATEEGVEPADTDGIGEDTKVSINK